MFAKPVAVKIESTEKIDFGPNWSAIRPVMERLVDASKSSTNSFITKVLTNNAGAV